MHAMNSLEERVAQLEKKVADLEQRLRRTISTTPIAGPPPIISTSSYRTSDGDSPWFDRPGHRQGNPVF